MRDWKSFVRYVILLLINAVPMILAILLYSLGGNFDIVFFFPSFCFLLWLNCRNTSVSEFLLIQCAYGLFTLAAGYASTMLYTRNISNDGLSYAIGQLLTIAELVMIILATFIAVICKLVIKYRRQTNTVG